jgi:hypothetical protein
LDEFRDFLRRWVGILLVLAGLARAFLLVAHEPIVGFANQYDMNRTGACVGLFPALKDVPVATPEAPITFYRTDARAAGCYQSTEVFIVATTLAVARAVGIDTQRFHLQWIGFTKLLLLFATALVVAFLLRDHFGASLVHGAIVLLVLSDPVVTLWLNTLYTEFGAIWAIYATIAALTVVALHEPPAWMGWVLLVAGLVALAFSREQFAFLGLALLAAAWPWLWHTSERLTVATLVIAMAASIVSFSALKRPDDVRKANRTDAYLGIIVPASSEPARGLATLGMSEGCAPLVGATWYRQRGQSVEKECLEVPLLSSFAFLRFLSDEPAVLGRSLARVMPATQGLAPAYLGTLAGQKQVARELPWWAFSPLEEATVRMPAAMHAAFMIAVFVLAPASLIVLLVMRRYRGDPLAPLLLGMTLGGVALYAFLTTVFGDGASEAARHYLPGALAAWSALIAFLIGIPFVVARWLEAKKEALLDIAAGGAALALAGYAAFVIFGWMQSQPLALGVMDQPAGRDIPVAPLKVQGWALDASGIESVTVHAGEVKKAARIGLPSPVQGMLRVETFYPGYPDAARAGYEADFTAEELTQAGAPNPVALRIEVKGRNGAAIEVDRRNLRFTQ